MALADPLGPISKLAVLLQTSLQATHVWGSFAATIHHHHLPAPASGIVHTKAELVALRPFALIWTNDRDGIRFVKETAGQNAYSAADGEIVVRIERNTPTGMTPAEAARDFENLLGRIIKGTAEQPGLMDLSGDPRYMPIVELTLAEHARTAPEKINDIGDAQRAFLLVTWSTA